MKYTKRHLSRYFAKEAKILVMDAEDITTIFLKSFADLLIDMDVDDVLEIRGFGIFRAKMYKGRVNLRNPMTGEAAVMPARKRLTFKPSDVIRREYKKL